MPETGIVSDRQVIIDLRVATTVEGLRIARQRQAGAAGTQRGWLHFNATEQESSRTAGGNSLHATALPTRGWLWFTGSWTVGIAVESPASWRAGLTADSGALNFPG